MRVPVAAVCLFLSLVLVTQDCESSPFAILKAAFGLLSPITSGLISDLRAKRAKEKITVRVWMHNGDRKMNGCGFHVRVDGYAGNTAKDSFPREVKDKCPGFFMRITSPSALYERDIRLGNENVKQVELGTEGWYNTFINVMCIGFNSRTIAGGPRGFCLNNDILKGCKGLKNKYQDININFSTILLTKSGRGAQKIVFQKVDELVGEFEKLQRNPNDEHAMRAVCDHIDLIKGDGPMEKQVCPAKKVTFTPTYGNWAYGTTTYKYQETSPYGCNRFEDK